MSGAEPDFAKPVTKSDHHDPALPLSPGGAHLTLVSAVYELAYLSNAPFSGVVLVGVCPVCSLDQLPFVAYQKREVVGRFLGGDDF
jgi:hypothetical protein